MKGLLCLVTIPLFHAVFLLAISCTGSGGSGANALSTVGKICSLGCVASMAVAAGPAGAGAGVAPDFVWWVICQGKKAFTRGRARGRDGINCPKTDGIDAEFVTAQLEASDSSILAESPPMFSEQASSGKVLGLALVHYRDGWQDYLEELSPEARWMAHHWGGHLPAQHRFEVVEVAQQVQTQDPQAMGYGLGLPHHNIHCLTPQCRDRLLASPVWGPFGNVATVLQRWEARVPALVGQNRSTAVQLPHPVAPLLTAGWWEELCFDCRMKCGADSNCFHLWRTMEVSEGAPMPIRRPEIVDPSRPLHDTELFQRSMFQSIGSQLQRWSGIILAGVQQAGEDHADPGVVVLEGGWALISYQRQLFEGDTQRRIIRLQSPFQKC